MEIPTHPRFAPYPLRALLAGNSNIQQTFEQDPLTALYPLQTLLKAAQATSLSFLTPPPTATILAGNSNLPSTTFLPTSAQVIQGKSVQYPPNSTLL